jgi:hypothetical protein
MNEKDLEKLILGNIATETRRRKLKRLRLVKKGGAQK